MRDKNFDKLLQEKLLGHEYANSGPDWSRMEYAMNQVDKDISVDSEIRNRLIHHKVKYQPSHWELLKERLEFEKKLKERIIFSKLAETVILILLIISVIQFTEFKNLKTKTSSQDFARAEILRSDSNINTIEGENNSSIQNAASNLALAMSTAIQAKQVSVTNTKAANAESAILESFNFVTSNSSSKTTVNGYTPLANVSNNDVKSANAKRSEGIEKRNNSIVTNTLTAENKAAANAESTLLKSELRSIEAASSIDKLIAFSELETNSAKIAAPFIIIKPVKSKEKWIGFSAGVDINTINENTSLADFNLIKQPQNFLTTSFSSGINYGIKVGANELIFGVDYSVKSYDPNFIESVEVVDEVIELIEGTTFNETVGLNSESIDVVDESVELLSETIVVNSSFYNREHTLEKYNIVSIPVQYRRHFNHNAKVHTYAFAGIASNYVTHTEFEQVDELRAGLSRPKFERDEAAQFQTSDFSPGVLEGGSIYDNLYFTAIGGLGMETQIKKIKIFAEGQYKRNVFASILGPRKVRLNSVSLNAGVKYRL